MPDPYDITDFGHYLTDDPDLLAKYREQLRQLGEPNSAHADLPRLVVTWRSDPDSAHREQWSARQVESWLLTKNCDHKDLEEFQVLAGAFIRERSS